MLIYIIFMVALSIFFFLESKKVAEGRSSLLKDFCKDPSTTKTALSMLRIICLSSAASAFIMLIPFLMELFTGVMPAPIAALSILCYTAGFIIAMLKLKNL